MKLKKRILSLLLCGAMLFSLGPRSVLAEENGQAGGVTVGTSGLCEHHPEHNADCGYTEGTAGTPCNHEHTEDCYTLVTECVHEHDEDCYPEESVSGNEAAPSGAQKREPTECTHVCSEESGCITKELNCQHEHDDGCGYSPATAGTPCGYVCELCGGEDSEKPAGPSNAEAVTVASVQAMIDALPGADEITDDNAEEVEERLEAIDEAKAQLSDEETDELDFTRYMEAAAALGALAAPMLLANDSPDEQFSLAPGGRYYFDLSAMNIPGTANGDLPDSTLHYVPFTYAGTVDAYKLTSAMATTEEHAEQNKYDHSLFVADYAVTHTISWGGLNDEGLIFGKNYASGGVDYTLRAPSVGSSYTGSGDSERGTPQSNEWDTMLNKNSGYIQNWNKMYSWGQDVSSGFASSRARRGYDSARYWHYDYATDSGPRVGFRPVLEVLNPDTLGSDGMKVVTLNLNGGKLGGSSDAIQIIVKTGEDFAAPSREGLTGPDGRRFKCWQGSDGKAYEAGDLIPSTVTSLTARWEITPTVTSPAANTLTYTGSAQALVSEGSTNGGTLLYSLEEQSDYSTDIPKGTNAGIYKVWYKVVGDDSYADVAPQSIDVKIAPKDISDAAVTLGDSLTYNGQQQTQSVTSVEVDGLEVTYDVTGDQNTNAGNYKMTLTGTGNFTGTKEVPWSIGKKDIADAKITLLPSPIYNGRPQIQGIYSVTVDGVYAEITYTVTGDIGTDAGTYTMTLTGTGNFTGEAFATWEIQAADNDWIEEPSVTNWTYGDAPTVKAGRSRFGTVTVEYFTKDGNTSFGTTVPTNAGSYRAAFKVVEDSNYKDLSKHVDFTIAKAPLTVTANPKTITYGEKPANDGVTYEGFVNGENEEVLTGTLDFVYDYEQYGNVGSYHITPKGLTSGNYDITFTKGILTVKQKDVTIQGVAVKASKVYDGTAVATITGNGTLSANFDGENLTFHVGTAAYGDKNVGADKTVTFTGFSLEGSAAGNYRLTGQPQAVTASITPMSIALTATAKDKTYDGTLTAELGTVTHSDFVEGDDVQLVNGTPSFSSKDKGENIQVTFTPFTLTGPDAGNYALTQPTGVKAGISPKPVTVSGITAQDKTYDGNTQVTFVYEGVLLDGNVDGDKLTVTAQGSFENANVGSKQVNITGLTLGGEKQGNYVLAEKGQQTSATAAITANSRYLDLSGLDLGGDPGTVWIDGEKEPINTSGGSHILLSEEAEFLTTYTYTQNGEGDDYPIGMRVYRFHRKDTGVTLEEITEFENLLNYAGCSIRLSGKQGIRMITGITQDNKKALTSKAGLSGYTLEEYGTVVMRGVGTPTLANSQSHNFAYKKGKADPIFSRANGMIQYTNVLVGFSLDDCKDTLTLRPYIKLKDMTTGEIVTLYGGCVCRSIYQVAKQNENTYKPGTAGYKYIHKILNYTPTAEQGGKTK